MSKQEAKIPVAVADSEFAQRASRAQDLANMRTYGLEPLPLPTLGSELQATPTEVKNAARYLAQGAINLAAFLEVAKGVDFPRTFKVFRETTALVVPNQEVARLCLAATVQVAFAYRSKLPIFLTGNFPQKSSRATRAENDLTSYLHTLRPVPVALDGELSRMRDYLAGGAY